MICLSIASHLRALQAHVLPDCNGYNQYDPRCLIYRLNTPNHYKGSEYQPILKALVILTLKRHTKVNQ